jgi:hypothetical protein
MELAGSIVPAVARYLDEEGVVPVKLEMLLWRRREAGSFASNASAAASRAARASRFCGAINLPMLGLRSSDPAESRVLACSRRLRMLAPLAFLDGDWCELTSSFSIIPLCTSSRFMDG